MHNAMHKRRAAGFTLIELMIVVAIIAIIAAIAYPNYTRYAFRTRRADAHEALMRVAAAQERFYTNRNQYAAAGDLDNVPLVSEKGYYQIAINLGAGNQTYNLVASPVAGMAQVGDKCGDLNINSSGNKDADPGDESNGKCW